MALWRTDRLTDRQKKLILIFGQGELYIYSNSNQEMIKSEGKPNKITYIIIQKRKEKKSTFNFLFN